MRNFIKIAGLPVLLVLVLYACKKEVKTTDQEKIPTEVMAKIKSMGLSTVDVKKIDQRYLVEGDILLSEDDLKKDLKFTPRRIGNEEQYWEGVAVCGLPRTITVSLDPSLGSHYVTMVDIALDRYNSLGLLINFIRVAGTGGNIHIYPVSHCGFLAAAGFPSGCNPYPWIEVATCYLDSWNVNTCATIIAHEIGHCIGYRHTDWMDKTYSGCPPPYVEYPANHIPGTPTGPDAGSWMLACIGNGMDRPFTGNDVTALFYLY